MFLSTPNGLLASCIESRLGRSTSEHLSQNKQNGEVKRLILRYQATIELEQNEAKQP
jgi:hypothetical protein